MMSTAPNDVASLGDVVKEIEREHIMRVLRQAQGNKLRAAKLLKISRGTLYRRLRAFGLEHLVRDPLQGLK